MALTLESHLSELCDDIKSSTFSKTGEKQIKRITALEKSCYVCRRIEFNFAHMIETAVILWDTDYEFRPKLAAQPYFCLPHYRRFLEYASHRLGKKDFVEFEREVSSIVNTYAKKLNEDISWFCKKFDYRYADEPWYDSKDAVERSMKFLRSDLHVPPQKKKNLHNDQ